MTINRNRRDSRSHFGGRARRPHREGAAGPLVGQLEHIPSAETLASQDQQRRLTSVVSAIGFFIAFITAIAQWIQGVSLIAVGVFLVLSVFAVVFVRVKVIDTWTNPWDGRLRTRANASLILVGVASASMVAVLVVLNPPEIGGWSFLFAGVWAVLIALAVSASKEWAYRAAAHDRRQQVSFRAGVTTVGMTLVAIGGGEVGLIIREAMNDSFPMAVFFSFQAVFIWTLAMLMLQSRRRGVGIGLIALGFALLGTAFDTLLTSDTLFGWAFMGLAASVLVTGVCALFGSGYWLGFALVAAGGSMTLLGLAARANGTLPFALIYMVAGLAAGAVGLLAIVWGDDVRWRPGRRVGKVTATAALLASIAVAGSSAWIAVYWLTVPWLGLSMSFFGFTLASLALAVGAVWARLNAR